MRIGFVLVLLVGCQVPGAAPEDCDVAQGKALIRKAGKWDCVPLPVSVGGLTKTQADDAYRAKGDVPITDLAKTGCTAGQVLKFEEGAWKCAADAVGTSTTYTAGAGLALTGSEFSVDATVAKKSELDTVSATASAALTKAAADALYRPAGGVGWSEVTGAPSFVTEPPTCAAGQFVKKANGGWECGVAGGVTFNSLDSLQGLLNLPSGSGLGTSMSKSQADVVNGGCISIAHGWNTNAVGYSAWMTERFDDPRGSARWVPVGPGVPLGWNLARGRPAEASAVETSYVASFAVDGNASDGRGNSSWVGPTGALPIWQVRLDGQTPVTLVNVKPSPDWTWTTTSTWDLYAANAYLDIASPNSSWTKIGSGSCSNATCQQMQVFKIEPPVQARMIRFVPTGRGGNNVTLHEFEVFSSAAIVSQPDANGVTLCNYTGEPRSMALRVWR